MLADTFIDTVITDINNTIPIIIERFIGSTNDRFSLTCNSNNIIFQVCPYWGGSKLT